MNHYRCGVVWEYKPQIEALQRVARKLGPERCQSALAAFEGPAPRGLRQSWSRCVIARAYGPPGALLEAAAVANPEGILYYSEVGDFAEKALGLDQQELREIIDTFDRGDKELLRGLLEQEAAKLQVRQTA